MTRPRPTATPAGSNFLWDRRPRSDRFALGCLVFRQHSRIKRDIGLVAGIQLNADTATGTAARFQRDLLKVDPALTVHGPELRRERRKSILGLIIHIKSPIAFGRVVIIAHWLPSIRRVLAGKHDDDGAIVSQRAGRAPVFQQTKEIFHTAAVIRPAALDDALIGRGVDGSASGGARRERIAIRITLVVPSG